MDILPSHQTNHSKAFAPVGIQAAEVVLLFNSTKGIDPSLIDLN